jgi:hypothetical protein
MKTNIEKWESSPSKFENFPEVYQFFGKYWKSGVSKLWNSSTQYHYFIIKSKAQAYISCRSKSIFSNYEKDIWCLKKYLIKWDKHYGVLLREPNQIQNFTEWLLFCL